MTTLPIRLSQPPSFRPLPFPAKKYVIRATLSTRVNSSPTSHSDSKRAGLGPLPKANPVTVTAYPKILDDTELEPRGLTDFVDQSRQMIRSSKGDGGPPRWFSPVECSSVAARAVESPPLLLYLPGLDGVGLGLIRHQQRLQTIFDVWCLHIPVMDQTPFEGLIEYVENTIKLEVADKLDKPIYLVGESLGACIALSVAARNPDVDFVLVLANPGTSFSNSQLQYLSVILDVVPEPLHNSIPYFLSFIAGNLTRMATSTDNDELSLEETIGALPMSFTQMLPNLTFLAEILPKDSLVWKLKMLKSASLYANSRLHAVKADTLILASGRDQLLPSHKEAERLSKTLANCRIRHYNNSGHTIFLEGGNDLVSVIKATNLYRHSRVKDYVSDYLLPTPYEFKKAVDGYRWVELAADPVMLSTLTNGNIVRSLEGIPSVGPTLFVGYHMLMGFDLGHLISRLFTEKNIHLRGIGHPFMFDRDCEKLMFDSSSFDSIRVMGAVPVSASGLYKLLSKKSHILLYPGGSREACHKKGEQYKLFWPEQSEFVRMASRFEATIIPFAVVGEDDIAEVVLDIDDYKNIPFYESLHKAINQEGIRLRSGVSGEVGNQDLYLPGIMPKLPGRLYFLFGKPIETKGRKDELKDKNNAQRLYMHIKSEIENMITYLKEKREKDPYRSIFSRLIYQAVHGTDVEIPTFEIQ